MSLLRQLSDELEALVARTAPAVVGVAHRGGQGTGLVLAPDGWLLTNCHVVRGQGEIRVGLASGDDLRGDIAGVDERTDLALVRIGASGLPSLSLADRRRLHVGQLVVAIGNPLHFDRSVSLGVVSAVDRSLPAPGGHLFEGLVQTDAAINPGNSGGPLLDADGHVVGINTAIIPFAQGIGFAVPAHTVQWVAAVLMRKGEVSDRTSASAPAASIWGSQNHAISAKPARSAFIASAQRHPPGAGLKMEPASGRQRDPDHQRRRLAAHPGPQATSRSAARHLARPRTSHLASLPDAPAV
jgi:S1-C subfamily serine protease